MNNGVWCNDAKWRRIAFDHFEFDRTHACVCQRVDERRGVSVRQDDENRLIVVQKTTTKHLPPRTRNRSPSRNGRYASRKYGFKYVSIHSEPIVRLV
jgi:hypothetical protein